MKFFKIFRVDLYRIQGWFFTIKEIINNKFALKTNEKKPVKV